MATASNTTLLASCPQQLSLALPNWEGFFDSLSAKIFQLTTASQNSQLERKNIFFAMNQLHAQQSEITFNVNQYIQDYFQQFCTQPAENRAPLNLTDYALDNELTALHYRLSQLLGYNTPITTLPLHPLALQEYFNRTWQALHFDTALTKLATQTFAAFSSEESEQLCRNLNQWLISHAISPDLQYKKTAIRARQNFLSEASNPATSIKVNRPHKLHHHNLQAINAGNWLTHTTAIPPQAVKLSWLSPLTGRYVFVSQDGTVALDLSGIELQKWLDEGYLTPS